MLYKGGGSEAYAKAFLVLFGTFASIAALVGVVTEDWALVPIALTLVAVAGFIWLTYFPAKPDEARAGHLGGGLRMARVVLGTDEQVAWSTTVNFSIGNRGVSRLRAFMNNLIGELYLTDRRLIFIPFRLSMRTAPVWLALRDLESIEESHRPGPAMAGDHSFDLKAITGATIVIRLGEPEPLRALTAAIAKNTKFSEATSCLESPEEPGRFALVWLWGITASFVTLVIATEGTDGFRIPMLGLMAGAIMIVMVLGTVRVGLNWLRHRPR